MFELIIIIFFLLRRRSTLVILKNMNMNATEDAEPTPKCPQCGQEMEESSSGLRFQMEIGYVDSKEEKEKYKASEGHYHEKNCTRVLYRCATHGRVPVCVSNRCPLETCNWRSEKCHCCDAAPTRSDANENDNEKEKERESNDLRTVATTTPLIEGDVYKF